MALCTGPLRTDLLSQILWSYCRRSPSPPHCFIQPPLAFIHCGFTPLFFKPTARRRDPYQNTVETEHNHASSGGGGEYTGRRVDDTMQVIHAEVLLKATTLDLESVLFFVFFGAVETRGSGFLRSPLTEVVVLNEPMVGRRLLLTTMSRF